MGVYVCIYMFPNSFVCVAGMCALTLGSNLLLRDLYLKRRYEKETCIE